MSSATAMDIFFTKRVKYEPNNKTYQATGDETQQGQPVEQLTEEERRYREYIKQRDEKKNQPTEDKTQQPQPSSQPNNVQNKQITEEERRYREYLKQRDKK
jgi:hypothetical protein